MTNQYQSSLTGPAVEGSAIVPSDQSVLPQPTRALYIGASGDLRVVLLGGDTLTFKAVPAGSVLPVRVSAVLATGTTATDILGLR
jgi:hypothetical protein